MKKKFIIGGAIVLAAVIYLLVVIIQNLDSYYVGVSEFYEKIEEIGDSNLRVAGTIAENSINWDADDVELSFVIVEGGESLPVLYNGAQPSGFTDGAAVLVEGKWDDAGLFLAETIIMKCSSKYEARLE